MMFDGATYDPDIDGPRLKTQMERVFHFMSDGRWHTIDEVHAFAGGREAAISSRIRDLRKPKFGGHSVQAESMGRGVWRYRLIVRTGEPEQMELAV